MLDKRDEKKNVRVSVDSTHSPAIKATIGSDLNIDVLADPLSLNIKKTN